VGAQILHAARRVPRRPVVLLAVAFAVAFGMAVGGRPALAASGSRVPTRSSVTLLSESPAFVSSASGTTLSLRVSSPAPSSQLSLLVTLYSHVSARYTFRETLSGDTAGLSALPGGPEIPLDSPGLDWVPGGKITLHLPVSAPDLRGGLRGGTDHSVLDINDCLSPNCGGVYPMQVSLVDSVLGRTLSSFTTDLIVTPPSELHGTYPVRFAWVMPLGSSPAISPARLPLRDTADSSELQTLTAALEGAPHAAISLDVFPQFVESLRLARARGDASGAALLDRLASYAQPNGQASVIAGTFAPVDLRALVSAGLGGYATTQLSRGRAVLGALVPSEAHTYVANTPIASGSLAALESAGITRLLVPNASVQPEHPSVTLTTPTAPFLIPHSGVEAVASDAYLEADLAHDAPPALKAQQMLADLALLYFDEPSDPKQGVALLSPLSWHPDAAFVSAVLSGLSRSRIVDAVTLSDLFANVTPGYGNSPGERQLQASQPPSSAGPSGRAVATAERQLGAVSRILPTPHPGSTTEAPLGDMLLMSQASDLTPAERSLYLGTIASALDREAALITVPFGHTITITSLEAKIPISILSEASVPLRVTLLASSPSLGFPHGRSWPVSLTSRENVVQIELLARGSGDSPLHLVVAAPNGVVLQAGEITIRSTAISGVAIGLSFGAMAFLIVWWARAIIQKRRRQHRLRGAALAAMAIPEGAPKAPNAQAGVAPKAPGPTAADPIT
jgi:hypothetical protein